jgi:hypothetical protein
MSTLNGNLPRVSTILRILEDSYAGVPQAAMEAAAERGEALHRLCLSYLASLDGVHEAPVPTPPYEAAYQAFVRWCELHAILAVAIEESSVSVKHGYRGTPDALIIYRSEEMLIDLKFTASILPINHVQVQAYWHLDDYSTAKRSALLHIHPVTGDMKLHPIKQSPHDWAAFLNALSVWRWRQS